MLGNLGCDDYASKMFGILGLQKQQANASIMGKFWENRF